MRSAIPIRDYDLLPKAKTERREEREDKILGYIVSREPTKILLGI